MTSRTDTNFGTDTLKGIQVAELTSLNQLSRPINRHLFEWWSNISSKFPKRSDFIIDEHIRIASNLFLAERIGIKKYTFLVCGEEICNITGRKSHKVTFEPQPDDYVGSDNYNQLIEHYEKIVATKKAHFCKGNTLILGKRNSGFESVDCPLFDENGSVSHIIGTIELNK